jgi:hypothetical protein
MALSGPALETLIISNFAAAGIPITDPAAIVAMTALANAIVQHILTAQVIPVMTAGPYPVVGTGSLI